MSLYIKRGKDVRRVRAMVANLADIPNGVTLNQEELVNGSIIPEGALVSRDSAGMGHLVKTAEIYETAGSTAKSYKIKKGSQFKVGDVVMLTVGGAAYAITAIDRESSNVFDTITVGTTLGAASEGAVLKLAATAGTSGALKYSPVAILGDGYNVDGTNQFVVAVTIGQFKNALVAPIDNELKTALRNNGAYINFV